MQPQSIDLNADLGEGFPHDAELMQIVTSANICSGAYIPNDEPVKAALALAKAHDVRVGIHVGYPDVEGFGRTSNFMSPAEFKVALDEQVDSFLVLAKAAGVEVKYLKPHGALYHDLIPQSELWTIILRVCFKHDWSVVHLAGSNFLKLAAEGIGTIHEGFVDRRYESTKQLLARDQKGAVLQDEAEVLAQAKSLVKGRLKLNDGRVVSSKVNSLCLHGDTPGAVQMGGSVRRGLLSEGFELAPYERITLHPYGPKSCIVRVHEEPSYELTKRLNIAEIAFKELPFIIETRTSYNELLLRSKYDIDLEFVLAHSHKAFSVPQGMVFFTGPRNHEIWTSYIGPDLDFVSSKTGLSKAEIIHLHTQKTYTVYALGFQPGFAFLGALPFELQLPRKSVPRDRVPPNSVAIAADQTAIYPHASPGGWHLIGVAEAPIFDPESPTLCPFKPGDTVQFKDISTR